MRKTSPAIWSHFFFNDTATTEIYTLSLHDALPISLRRLGDPLGVEQMAGRIVRDGHVERCAGPRAALGQDRKSTRLNSSHGYISYAVFCLKKKNAEDVASYLVTLKKQEPSAYADAS